MIRVADRVGKGIRNSPRDALIADSVDPSVRGRAFGFRSAADNAGGVLGPLIAFALLQGVRPVAAHGVLAGGDSRRDRGARRRVRRARSRRDRAASGKNGSSSARRSAREFWAFLAVIFVFTLGNSTDAFLLLRAQQLGVPVALAPILWALLQRREESVEHAGRRAVRPDRPTADAHRGVDALRAGLLPLRARDAGVAGVGVVRGVRRVSSG